MDREVEVVGNAMGETSLLLPEAIVQPNKSGCLAAGIRVPSSQMLGVGSLPIVHTSDFAGFTTKSRLHSKVDRYVTACWSS
eukprot:6475032-Amphidinium_carterae.1